MKRKGSLLQPDLPLARRARVLSEEERALWDAIATQLKPLRRKGPTKPRVAQSSAETPGVHVKASPRPVASAAAPKLPRPAAPPLVPLGRRERSRLWRGSSEIDARLDLHGMTQAGAHRALLGFLKRAHRKGLTFVLVITGKGALGAADSERGVLRRQVPHWLSLPEFRPLVVGFEPAHGGHGGAGALYVRIRRARS